MTFSQMNRREFAMITSTIPGLFVPARDVWHPREDRLGVFIYNGVRINVQQYILTASRRWAYGGPRSFDPTIDQTPRRSLYVAGTVDRAGLTQELVIARLGEFGHQFNLKVTGSPTIDGTRLRWPVDLAEEWACGTVCLPRDDDPLAPFTVNGFHLHWNP